MISQKLVVEVFLQIALKNFICHAAVNSTELLSNEIDGSFRGGSHVLEGLYSTEMPM